ncbi:MAG: oxidoreductase [candidate division KSB1 bacterium]|nr:oxidoreductase [candidate division KSB1 bacterium]MDZ7335927.1 oxidoreductase [candidate division KSB1 bacterium]MDZ7356788.1 oxidoreductase [candidate division KSB1 bacterium]MDZ7401253.1 oxidoreductase [candidate division KSB1 bacterium]
MTLDPGHFHAALIHKKMYPEVSPQIHIFAPNGPDVQEHLRRIEAYNRRSEDPTRWETILYLGDDYLERMLRLRPGNVVVISGNNRRKTEYIKACVAAGLHVLADKPMCMNREGFNLLREAFDLAQRKGVLLYDIMTERYEITTMLQKELIHIPEVFGELQVGSPEQPSIIKESVHHFFKYVSGQPLKRPGWYFDVKQQGDGLVDVTTHLVDLVQWECFPEQIIDFEHEIELVDARHWPTLVSPGQFQQVTQLPEFPDYLRPYLNESGELAVSANGEIVYKIRGIHVRIAVSWEFQAPDDGGDTHYSLMRGSKADVVIRQGKEQHYRPELYVEPADLGQPEAIAHALESTILKLQSQYPGIAMQPTPKGWQIIIPDSFRVGHEAHFAQVTEKFLQFLKNGKLPDWEWAYMMAKYHTTTAALELALNEH